MDYVQSAHTHAPVQRKQNFFKVAAVTQRNTYVTTMPPLSDISTVAVHSQTSLPIDSLNKAKYNNLTSELFGSTMHRHDIAGVRKVPYKC